MGRSGDDTMTQRVLSARLRALLAEADYPAIVALAGEHRRVLSLLTALTYDDDPSIADRAIEALGVAAGVISDADAEFVRGHLRRLFWLLNDESGGIGWRAPEAIGAIIRGRPERFAEFIPNLIWLLDMEAEDAGRFRASILRGIHRVAEVVDLSGRRDLAALLQPLLEDPDPEVRGLAAQCAPYAPSLPL
jgi:hypothetical protein